MKTMTGQYRTQSDFKEMSGMTISVPLIRAKLHVDPWSSGGRAARLARTICRANLANPDHADVILARPELASSRELAQAYALLDDAESRRASSFRFARDRDLYVYSHGFLRVVLAKYLEVEPTEIRYATASGGRPELAFPSSCALRFNLSHTHGLVACVVTESANCGVDVECLDYAGYQDLFDMVLSPGELAGILALPERWRGDRFLEIWTLKEAFLKGTGVGLSMPLRDIEFSGFDSERRCETLGRVNCHGQAWRFYSFTPMTRQMLSVAIRTDGRPASFTIFESCGLVHANHFVRDFKEVS